MPPVHRNPAYVDPMMELLTPVVDSLTNRESQRLQTMLQDLIKRNFTAGGSKGAFYHAGEIYTLLPRWSLRQDTIQPIVPQLEDEAETYRLGALAIKEDTKLLRQSLSVILPKCRDRQELRDALPETIIRKIPFLHGMERTREEGFLLEQNPMLKRQYDKAVNIALYYLAAQLIH